MGLFDRNYSHRAFPSREILEHISLAFLRLQRQIRVESLGFSFLPLALW